MPALPPVRPARATARGRLAPKPAEGSAPRCDDITESAHRATRLDLTAWRHAARPVDHEERITVTEREDEISGGPDYGGDRGGKSAGAEGGQGGKGEAAGKPSEADADRAKEREHEMEESGEELPG